MPDATSWLYGASSTTLLAAKLVLIALFLGAVAYVWRQKPPLAARYGLGAALTLAALLCGPGAHHNYQLWWLPFYAVTLSLALAPAATCQAAAARYTFGAKLDARGP